jgi:hypothetical protein
MRPKPGAALRAVAMSLPLLVMLPAFGQSRDPGRRQLAENTFVLDAFDDGRGNHILILGDDAQALPARFVFGRNRIYQVVAMSGFGGPDGSIVNLVGPFLEPRAKKLHEVRLFEKQQTLHCDDTTVVLKRVPQKTLLGLREGFASAKLIPHPDVRRPDYLFKLKGSDEYLYVDGFKHDFRFDTMRFFRGPKGKLRETRIAKVDRHRDGGSTFIHLVSGEVMYSPAYGGAAGKLPRKASFQTGGKQLPIERLDAGKADLAAIGVDLAEMQLGRVHTPCDFKWK